MLSTLFAVLGGNAFRLLFGELAAWLDKAREHRREIERIQEMEKVNAAQHAREMEAIRLQSEMGIKVIETQGRVDLDAAALQARSALDQIDAKTFGVGVELTGKSTGFRTVDAWNAAIRAMLATEMMILVGMHYAMGAGWKLDDRGWELAGAIFGVYTADRMLFRRGR